MKVITRNVIETIQIGEKLGKILRGGDVLCLFGDLGAGKTAFASGVGKGLGVIDSMPSPTFTIVHEYDTSPPLFHFDVYRVFDPEELFMIGFEEYFQKNGVILIEWASKIENLLPPDYVKIELASACLENLREIHVLSMGARSAEIVKELMKEDRP